jgi:hypothetical protein
LRTGKVTQTTRSVVRAAARAGSADAVDNGCVETVEEMLGEHAGNQFAPTADVGLVEDGLDVIAHGVG